MKKKKLLVQFRNFWNEYSKHWAKKAIAINFNPVGNLVISFNLLTSLDLNILNKYFKYYYIDSVGITIISL